MLNHTKVLASAIVITMSTGIAGAATMMGGATTSNPASVVVSLASGSHTATVQGGVSTRTGSNHSLVPTANVGTSTPLGSGGLSLSGGSGALSLSSALLGGVLGTVSGSVSPTGTTTTVSAGTSGSAATVGSSAPTASAPTTGTVSAGGTLPIIGAVTGTGGFSTSALSVPVLGDLLKKVPAAS